MDNTFLKIIHLPTISLKAAQRRQITSLCTEAYREDFSDFFDNFPLVGHVVMYAGDEMVSHAAWVERELRPANTPPLRSAYVEAVATAPAHRHKGYASRVMRALPPLLAEYDLGALSPFDPNYYAMFGWESWQGPLFCRKDGVVSPNPDDEVMILRLPRTPRNLDIKLSLECDWRPGDVW